MGLKRLLTGMRGEDEAERVLRKNGYRVIERNYRSRFGEIDIIAKDGDVIAFIEVKTRGNFLFGTPACGVDSRKRKKIVLASSDYLARKGLGEAPTRFDVVSVIVEGGSLQAEVIKDAFGADEDFF